MPLSRQLCQLGQYLMHPIPQSLLPLGYIFQVGVINAPGLMHAAGQPVEVVAAPAHQGDQLLQLRQFQTHHIGMNFKSGAQAQLIFRTVKLKTDSLTWLEKNLPRLAFD